MKKSFLIMFLTLVCAVQTEALNVTGLRIEDYRNPVGIDKSTIHLSWQLQSEQRGVLQTAYSVQIARDASFGNIVWESGNVSSDQSVGVEATGFQPAARTRYYWRVTVSDNKGKTATSTEKAYFETGLMRADAWNSTRWIKATTTPKEGRSAGVVTDYEVEVKFNIKSLAAGLIFAASDHSNYYMWQINTLTGSPRFRPHRWSSGKSSVLSENAITQISLRNGEQHTLKVKVTGGNVAKTYIDGNLIDTRTGDFAYGDFGFREDRTNDGVPEQAYFDDFIVRSAGEVLFEEHFETQNCMFSKGTVQDGQLYLSGPGTYAWQQDGRIGMPIFRKTFELSGNVLRARLYITGLGVYNAYINGERVGQTDDDGNTLYDELKPGSTDMFKTVFYTTHDVTALLREGKNAIGAELSSGWWNGRIARGIYGNKPNAFRALLRIEMEDGSTKIIPTDLTWLCNTNGPLRNGDIYNGETYDARLENGQFTPEYDDSDWFSVATSTDFTGEIRAFEGPAIMAVEALRRYPQTIQIYEGTKSNGKTFGAINVVEEIKGQNNFTLTAGQTAVIDLGQNGAGWVSFTAKGARGTKLRFRFGEMPNTTGDRDRGDDGPAGSIYTENLRSAEATLYYTLKGAEDGESFHPTSTYFGFQYIEVTTSADVELTDVIGETVTSAVEEKSTFRTSHEDVNQLYSNIMWGQRSNFVSVPTDCPQRDERMGWTADTQVYSMAGLYNSDTRNFYKKWMRDMRDSQRSDGAYGVRAPQYTAGYGTAAWSDAGVIVPWNVYLMTGDKEILKDNFQANEKYMSFLAAQAGDGYQYNGGLPTYGDWVAYVSTDSRYCSVCYYAYVADLMARTCRALSEQEGDTYSQKAAQYEQLFQNIKEEWQNRYTNTSTGTPKIATQCAYLMALHYNLLRDEIAIRRTINLLRSAIYNNSYKLNTGFLGTAILNQTLSENGLTDEAYTLLLQRNDPSWLYSIDQGATTIWERWNSYTKANGYGPVSMNSFNHYSYGAVAEWMFRHMAGIVPDEAQPGFKHFILQPHPDTRRNLRYQQKRITSVQADFASDYGSIKAEWQCDGSKEMTYRVIIPAGTTATLRLPVSDGLYIYESGIHAENAEGVTYIGTADGYATYEVGSGSYLFTVSAQIPDGIGGINKEQLKMKNENTIYNLAGQHLNKVQKGINIVSNKKILN